MTKVLVVKKHLLFLTLTHTSSYFIIANIYSMFLIETNLLAKSKVSREGEDFGLFITLVSKVLDNVLIRWLNNFLGLLLNFDWLFH